MFYEGELLVPTIILSLLFFFGPLEWPDSPLYSKPVNDPNWEPPETVNEAKAALSGHYAHFDIVAYESEMAEKEVGMFTMRSFVISYGFSDLVQDGNDELVEHDRFCHAEYKLNSRMLQNSFSDAAVQAIEPRVTSVDVSRDEQSGHWNVWRPPTPTLLGIDGDPDLPLSMDPNDPNVNDDDGDGKPGVTVDIAIAQILQAELYIARREIFGYGLTLYSDGTLFGHVEDESEQLVLGATLDFLAQENNPLQFPDPGLSPIILIPIPDEIDTCDELMELRDELFPPEPEFF